MKKLTLVGIGMLAMACLVCVPALAVTGVPHAPLASTAACPNGTGALTTPYGAPATSSVAGSLPIFGLGSGSTYGAAVTSWPAAGNWDFCAALDTASCSLGGLGSFSTDIGTYAPLFLCITDINGPVNPSPPSGTLPVTGNGIPDGEFELGVLAAVLNNTYTLDPAKTGGVTNAQILTAYQANFNYFKGLVANALAHVPLNGSATDVRFLVPSVAPYLPNSLTAVLAAYATEGNANTLAALDALLGALTQIGITPPPGGVASVTTGFPAILGPGGDPDGDKFTNYQEYAAFKSSGAAATIAAQFNAATVPPVVPITGSIVINDNASATKDVAVTLTLTWGGGGGAGVTQQRFSDDGAHWTAWEAVTATRPYTLPAGDGHKTVRVQFKDDTGRISGSFSDFINLDGTPPTGSIIINGGALSTSTQSVSLGLTWADAAGGSGVVRMRFSDDGAHWSAWETLKSPRAYSLPIATTGYQTVRAQFRDGAGNISPTYNDYIKLVVK